MHNKYLSIVICARIVLILIGFATVAKAQQRDDAYNNPLKGVHRIINTKQVIVRGDTAKIVTTTIVDSLGRELDTRSTGRYIFEVDDEQIYRYDSLGRWVG